MDSSKLVEQALRALQSAPESSTFPTQNNNTQMDWSNALVHLMQNQSQNQTSAQNNQNQTNSLPSNSNGDSSSSPAPSNTPPENNKIKLENNPISDNAFTSLYNSLLTAGTPETSTPVANNVLQMPSFSELSPNIGSASRNKLAKRDPTQLAENERLALVNKRASDRKAAQKYRRKKKMEMDLLVSENSALKERTKELENQLEQATTAIRMLGEQINNQGGSTQPVETQNLLNQNAELQRQIKELLNRNAELEKSVKSQNVIEELLSQYAKTQAQNGNIQSKTE